MELIGQNHFPSLVQVSLRKWRSKQCLPQRGKQLRILIQKFTLAIVFLVVRLRGISSAMVFEIKLALPCR